MKRRNKKSPEDSSNDNPEAGAKAAKPKKTGPKLERLSNVAARQSAVVLVCGLVAAALLYCLILLPAETARHDERVNMAADVAKAGVEQRLALIEQVIDGYSKQSTTRKAIADSDRRAVMAQDLQQLFPRAEAAFVFPYGDIGRQSGHAFELSFVNIDLARKAESGRQIFPDAFPRDDQWYVQFAAPVRDPDNHAVQGTLLIVFKAAIMSPALALPGGASGKVALLQTVSGQSQTVLASGSGSGAAATRPLSASNWSLQYQAGAAGEGLINPALALAIVLLPMLVAIIVVWLLMTGAQKSLRKDIAVLIQWAHKAFSGERSRLPALKWDMVASVGEVLQRLAQVTDKRVARAEGTVRPKNSAAARGSSASATSHEEPLFEETDSLDIDMLDGDDDVLGLGDSDSDDGGMAVDELPVQTVSVPSSIFRAYDIRGIVGETLDRDIVHAIGQAIGSEALDRSQADLCVGYDGRHSSPDLADALSQGILSTGCNVINIGAVPTPVLYFATHHLETGSGVMVTGSHNPANYNGLKMMLAEETLSGDGIQALLTRIQQSDLRRGQGAYTQQDIRRDYLDRIVDDIAVAAPLRVVLDAGNGIAGELAPILVEELGCEVVPLFCEVDGDFPNHHPDPGKPENLSALIEKVQEEKADIGLAFDGDGDRLGVVTNSGRIIWPDRLLMLFARDVVSRNPGSDVIYDVKCSRRLAGVISEAGGRPIMWKTGHSLIKAKMRETGAPLAGEMSGHMFFKERWYGFDDGLYAAARLLEILGIEDRDTDDVFEELPDDLSTPEINVDVSEDTKFAIVDKLASSGDFGDSSIYNIDGVRVEYQDGWGLCRASNTTPVLVLRFEAENEAALERIKTIFREQLRAVAPEVSIDF